MFNSNSNRVFASSRKAPCIRLVTIGTPGLLDPVGRHALMFGFDDNCSPTRLYRSFERIRDLRPAAFLNLQLTLIGFDDACNHADPYYTPVRQVRNVCLTDNRHDMMLAVRHELDILARQPFRHIGPFLRRCAPNTPPDPCDSQQRTLRMHLPHGAAYRPSPHRRGRRPPTREASRQLLQRLHGLQEPPRSARRKRL